MQMAGGLDLSSPIARAPLRMEELQTAFTEDQRGSERAQSGLGPEGSMREEGREERPGERTESDLPFLLNEVFPLAEGRKDHPSWKVHKTTPRFCFLAHVNGSWDPWEVWRTDKLG